MKRLTHLIVCHCVDRYGKPLLTVENLPGEGAERYPAHAKASKDSTQRTPKRRPV